jgi:hypothetical protein
MSVAFSQLMAALRSGKNYEVEQACSAAGINPVEALARKGLHRSTWFRWKRGTASPNLRSLAAARDGLEELKTERAAAA